MDWFSWLSRTGLDPLLTYEYGLLFARNGLQIQDTLHFNHDFLHNIGISVPKHRLEILKLAQSQSQSHNRTPSHKKPLLSAFSKTTNCLRNCLRKLVFTPSKSRLDQTEFSTHSTDGDAFRRKKKKKQETEEEVKQRRPWTRHVSLSGPLDGRVSERAMTNSKSLKLSGPLDRKERPAVTRSPRTSGPLDGKISEWITASCKSPKANGPQGKMMKLIPPSRSPRVSGPLDGREGSPRVCCRCNKEKPETDYDYHSLWVSLFYDMKPT